MGISIEQALFEDQGGNNTSEIGFFVNLFNKLVFSGNTEARMIIASEILELLQCSDGASASVFKNGLKEEFTRYAQKYPEHAGNEHAEFTFQEQLHIEAWGKTRERILEALNKSRANQCVGECTKLFRLFENDQFIEAKQFLGAWHQKKKPTLNAFDLLIKDIHDGLEVVIATKPTSHLQN